MRIKYIYSFVLILSFFNVIGQEKLSKNNIFSYWKKNVQVYDTGVKAMEGFIVDDSIIRKLRIFNKRYDTVGFFVMSEGGTTMVDSGGSSSLTSDVYVFWMQKGASFMQQIAGRNNSGNKRTGKDFFSFYIENKQEIDKEYIMPVILGAEKKDTTVVFNQIISDHQSSYLLYCKMGSQNKTISFNEQDVTDHQSLFYEDNLRLKSYTWVLKTKNEILIF